MVSILVHGSDGDKLLTGRVVVDSITEAVESLAFLLGARWREDGGIYYVGGKGPDKVLSQFPSYGLKASEVGSVLREGVSVVGDRVIAETDQMRAAQIGEVLKVFEERQALNLEIFILDCAMEKVDRVNAWLDTFQLGARYFEDTAIPYKGAVDAIGGAIGGGGDAERVRGFTYRVDAAALLDFVRTDGDIRVELRQQIQVLSGSRSTFASGQVEEDVTYTTVPGQNTAQQLVSSISRRTVGLQMDVEAVASGVNWVVTLRVDDSSLTGDRERTTTYSGQRFVRPWDGYFLLASYTRKSAEKVGLGVPILSSIPGIKSVFRKGHNTKGQRSVVVVARPLSSDWIPVVHANELPDSVR